MTLHDFIKLDERERRRAVWNAVHIAERQNTKYRISLYQIDAFYVEVFYRKRSNVFIGFRPFKRTNLLKPYLSKIDIDSLF